MSGFAGWVLLSSKVREGSQKLSKCKRERWTLSAHSFRVVNRKCAQLC